MSRRPDYTTRPDCGDVWYPAADGELRDVATDIHVPAREVVERIAALQSALFALVSDIDAATACGPYDTPAVDADVWAEARRVLGIRTDD